MYFCNSVIYDILGFEESYQGTCIGHAFSKACQYVTTNEFFCENLIHISILITQGGRG
jgi:hypothetical protein